MVIYLSISVYVLLLSSTFCAIPNSACIGGICNNVENIVATPTVTFGAFVVDIGIPTEPVETSAAQILTEPPTENPNATSTSVAATAATENTSKLPFPLVEGLATPNLPAKEELETFVTDFLAVPTCSDTEHPCWTQPNSDCVDTIGGYYCACKTGFTEVTNMDGSLMICGKPILVQQTFGLPYKAEYKNISSPEFSEIANTIADKITRSYVDQKAIITIRRITNGSLVVWYETTPLYYQGEQFTLSQLQSLHRDALQYGPGYGNITVSPPMPANIVACFPSTIRSHVLQALNMSWTFGEARPGMWMHSQETCLNSNFGYVASIPCKTRIDSGLVTGYYDPNSLKEIFCPKNPRDALKKIGNRSVTELELPDVMAIMAVISSTFEDSTTSDLQDFVSVFDYLAENVMINGFEVNDFTMSSILFAADNLHRSIMSKMTNALDDMDRMKFIDSLDIFTDHFEFMGESMEIEGSSLDFEASSMDNAANEISYMKTLEGNTDNGLPSSVFAHLPLSSLQGLPALNKRKAVFFLHRDALLFPQSTEKNAKISQVLSVQISNTDMQYLPDPLNVTFPTSSKSSLVVSQVSGCNYTLERCTFLNSSTGKWEYTGCETRSASMTGYTSCSCNHATNFAVLVQTNSVKSRYALSVLGTIGCVLSVVGLSLTIIIYLSFRALRIKKLNQIHIHLCTSLLVGYLTFLIGVQRPRLYAPCMAITAVLQFSFLAAWGWMVTEFFVMYRKFIHVFADIHGTFVLKACGVVYVGALTVTMVTFIIAYVTGDMAAVQPGWIVSASNDPLCWVSHYAGDRLCWLHSNSLYFGFLLPIGVMFFINSIGFFIIMKKLNEKRPNLGQNDKKDPELKEQVIRIFTISSMLGVTWIFAVPLTFSEDKVINESFGWLFSLGNAFQGLTLFILYCVRQKNVRNFWAGYFFIFIQRKKDDTKPLDISTVSTENVNKVLSGNIQMQSFDAASESTVHTNVTT